MESSKLVHITIEGNFPLKLHINTDGSLLEIVTYTDSNQYKAEIDRFYTGLRQFLQMAASIEPGNFRAAGRALELLHSIGRRFTGSIFGPQRFDLQRILRQLYPQWQTSLMSEDLVATAQPPVIKISGLGSLHLPLEFLPLFDLEWNISIGNLNDLFRAASKFAGFSAVICRELYDLPGLNAEAYCDGRIYNDSGLRIRYFYHHHLKNALKEKEQLQAIKHVSILEPWSVPPIDEARFKLEFCNQLLDGAFDHIQHLACHADTSGSQTSKHHLSLSYPYTNWLGNKKMTSGSITMEEIEQQFYAAPEKDHNKQYPLIFMNACAAARIDPLGTSSFPKLFHQNRNRGFIAPEIPVPDDLAYNFSTQFYEYLIKGESLSIAMHKTRKNILKFHYSPLGIIYTIYANPWLRVDWPALTDRLGPTGDGFTPFDDSPDGTPNSPGDGSDLPELFPRSNAQETALYS